ncbi:MAG: hypothetical protein ACK57B_12760 [Betaproteobacteria bacterium]
MKHSLRPFLRASILAAPLLLGGCGWLGIESPEQIAAKREADGRAIGAGCRHAARSVEACYELNKRADRSAIFAGWKEMHEYMAENKIEAVPPAHEADANHEPAAPASKSATVSDGEKVAAKPGG